VKNGSSSDVVEDAAGARYRNNTISSPMAIMTSRTKIINTPIIDGNIITSITLIIMVNIAVAQRMQRQTARPRGAENGA